MVILLTTLLVLYYGVTEVTSTALLPIISESNFAGINVCLLRCSASRRGCKKEHFACTCAFKGQNTCTFKGQLKNWPKNILLRNSMNLLCFSNLCLLNNWFVPILGWSAEGPILCLIHLEEQTDSGKCKKCDVFIFSWIDLFFEMNEEQNEVLILFAVCWVCFFWHDWILCDIQRLTFSPACVSQFGSLGNRTPYLSPVFWKRLVPVIGGPKIDIKGQFVCLSTGFFNKFYDSTVVQRLLERTLAQNLSQAGLPITGQRLAHEQIFDRWIGTKTCGIKILSL